MRVTAGNDMSVMMATIPNTATPSLVALKQSQRRTKFLTEITEAVNSSNKATNETRNLVCSLLARDPPDYKVPYSGTAHSEGFSLFDRLDEETTFAIISNAGLNTR